MSVAPKSRARRCRSACRLSPRLGGGRGLALQRQRDAAFGEDVVGGVQEVEHLAHAGVRDGLVDDLFGLHWGDARGQGGAEHDAVLAEGLSGDQRGELDHQPSAGVQVAVPEHFVEGEVVEILDQFRVGGGERRDVSGKEFLVISARRVADGHGRSLRLLPLI
jgi:hypothetical protein